MVPAWLMIICWAYLEFLVTTQTDKLAVSAIKLPFLWPDVFTFLCNNLTLFFSFHARRKSHKSYKIQPGNQLH